MPTRSEAEEHLRVIRSLMEKATIYRAISAPTALVGGLCSMLFGSWFYFHWCSMHWERPEPELIWPFLGGWLGVLAVTCATNTWFLWRDARRRGEPFVSAGMKQALKCLAPPLLCGGFATLWFVSLWRDGIFCLPMLWIVSYGLALLATSPFAPRSIPRLGWFFLIAGLASAYLVSKGAIFGTGESRLPATTSLLMVATFGLFHLIYAACTWPRSVPANDPGITP